MDASAALRLLVANAAPDVLRELLLQVLLDDTAPAAAPAPAARATARIRAQPAAPAKRTQHPADRQWDALRARVRDAMAERGATWADIASAAGLRASTVSTAARQRTPASAAIQVALRSWLAEAPAEAGAAPAPFPARTARRGNGAAAPGA